jgi:hypothetical protein
MTSKIKTLCENIDKYGYKDDIEYYKKMLKNHKEVENIFTIKNDYIQLSYDVFLTIFEVIYEEISVIDRSEEINLFDLFLRGYSQKMKTIYDTIKKLELDNKHYEAFLKYQHNRLETTNLELEKHMDTKFIYVVNEYNACNIVKFNQSVITDMNFGNSTFFRPSNQLTNLILLLDLYPKSSLSDVVDGPSSILNRLLTNNDYYIFKRLNKYYFFVMYYFQKKLTKTPISEYYRIKFFNFFKKLNYKISILITQELDRKFERYLNSKVLQGAGLSKLERNLSQHIFGYPKHAFDGNPEYVSHYDLNLISYIKILVKDYFSCVVETKSKKKISYSIDKDKLQSVIRDYSSNYLLYKRFNSITNYYLLNFQCVEQFEVILSKFALFYNTLTTILKPNDVSITGTNVYNYFNRTINDLDIKYDPQQNVNTEPMYSNTENNQVEEIELNKRVELLGNVSPVEGGGLDNNSLPKMSKISLKEAQNRKLIRDTSERYKKLFTSDDIAELTILADKYYFDKRYKSLDDVERVVDNLHPQVYIYDTIDKKALGEQPFIVLNLLNLYHEDLKAVRYTQALSSQLQKKQSELKKFIFNGFIPNYVSLHRSKYEEILYELNTIFDSIGNMKQTNPEITKSVMEFSHFDMLFYRFKKYFLKVIGYHMSFVNELIHLYNIVIEDEIEKYIEKYNGKLDINEILEHILKHRIQVTSALYEKVTNNSSSYDEVYYNLIIDNINKYIIDIFVTFKKNTTNPIARPAPESPYQDVYSYNYLLGVNLDKKKVNNSNFKFNDYELNHNFSKLMNKVYRTQLSSFNLSLDISSTIKFKELNFSNLDSYITYLIEHKELIKRYKLQSKNKFIKKKKTISRLTEIEDKKNRKNNVIDTINNVINITFTDDTPSTSEVGMTKNSLLKIQNNAYNCLFYGYKSEYLKLLFLNITEQFINNIFIIYNLHLQDDLILNIIVPMFIDLFQKSCSNKLTIKKGKKTHNFDDLLDNFMKDINLKLIKHFVFLKDDINFSSYYNLLLMLIYSEKIYEPYFKTKILKRKLTFNTDKFNIFYKNLLGNKLSEFFNDSYIEFITYEEFRKLYSVKDTKSVTTPKVTTQTPTTPTTPTTLTTPTTPTTPTTTTTKNKTPKKIITLNIEKELPKNLLSFKDERRNEFNVIDDVYQHLIDEKVYLNEYKRTILSAFRMYSSENREISDFKIDGYENLKQRLQIYKNLFITQRLYDHWSDIYTFLYSRDIHYTIIKYSILEEQKYKTCGAYTHITFRISQEILPEKTEQMSIYDGLINQIPNLTQEMYDKVVFITLHYGLSNYQSEYYNLEPSFWINLKFTDDTKIKSTKIDIDYLYQNFNSFTEFVQNLYELFIEFTQINNYEYYSNPTCTKTGRNLVFIQNDEIEYVSKK